MATIKSSAENLTLNADGSGNDIIFQSNGSNVGTLTAEGVLTATSFAGSGAALTGVGVDGITDNSNAVAITIDSSERVGLGGAPDAVVGSNGLHINRGDRGTLPALNGDAAHLLLEGSAAGMTILSTAGSGMSMIAFGDTDDADIGSISYYNANDTLTFQTNATKKIIMDSAGALSSTGGTAQGLHIKTSSAGTTPTLQADADELVIEGAAPGITLLAPANGSGMIAWGDVDDADVGQIWYYHAQDYMRFTVNAAERMRIHSNGIMSVPAGIEFGSGFDATGANTLDDYEEGQWTAALTPGGGSITVNGSYNTMGYTKIGRLVYCGGYISISGESSASGSLKLTGLPFTCRNNNDAKCSMSFWANGLSSGQIIQWIGEVIPNQTYCYFYRGASATIVDDCIDNVDSSFDMRFMFSYITDL